MTQFGIDIDLKLEASPEEIFDENSETSMLTHIIKGMQIDFQFQFWKELNKLVLKILENEETGPFDCLYRLDFKPIWSKCNDT